MASRLGYCKQVIEKKKCDLKQCHVIIYPLNSYSQHDSHYLVGFTTSTLLLYLWQQVAVPFSRVVKGYYAFVGGLDVHNLLRLQP
ncbi:LOW QUALITY PROTEIN: Hypothetical protein PHPALM_926 [Phytophthora palmivora]|uniref:Uncharacterized protein n=1 Tax=Phytophthora palmivora TaxID=4796 RepID=A0A2P4YTP0_9STRA|nr:LOW QUALITY PROTEIN: Hypothetical protein PHPALM_926 [Phytophthora palmivora]